MQAKWRNLSFLALAEFLAMGLWFSASAVAPQLTEEWRLSESAQSWLTMSVQAGFVAGALISAILNLADRVSAPKLMALSALAGALFNSAIPLFQPGVEAVIALRFLTGMALAGVYPPGMKLVATWSKTERGLGIGILVGALTLGSASPHLINGLPIFGEGGLPPWREALLAASGMALLGALVAFFLVKPGPLLSQAAPFNWKFAGQAMLHRPTRLANFGYLGHMWELYAMWTWAPILIIASYKAADWDPQMARVAGFGVIAIGAIGCVWAGKFADKYGRTTITSWSMIVSGACALSVGFFFSSPGALTALCLIWGFAVVADSAQFSAAVSELTDPRYIGTALTIQTSLGFLLTMLTIRLVPTLVDLVGWRWVFGFLALGPAFGVWSMLRLRALPEAARMASGNR